MMNGLAHYPDKDAKPISGQDLSRQSAGLWPLALIGAGLIAYAMRATPLRGDENTYVMGARAIADFVTGRGESWSATFDIVIGTGWFMPGLSILGAPLFMAFPDAPVWAIYGYIGLINAALLAALIGSLAPIVGPRWIALFAIFPALAPLWHVGALSFLPDLPAGLCATIAMGLAYRIAIGCLQGHAPPWRLIVALECCLIAGFYLRGPMLVVALALHVMLLILAFCARANRPASLARIAAGLCAFMVALGAWSVSASAHFEEPVISTTNFPLVIADGFGDHGKICFGPCPPGEDIVPSWEFAQARAAQTGQNPLAVQREMMAASLEGMSGRDYLVKVRSAFRNFLFEPGDWLHKKLEVSFAVPPQWRGAVFSLAFLATLALYGPFMLALIAANITPIRSSDSLAMQAMLIKGVTFCLFLQPFLHKSSARYWIGFAAIATWSAIVLLKAWRQRGHARGHSQTRQIPLWLDYVQIAYGAAFCVVAAAIAFA